MKNIRIFFYLENFTFGGKIFIIFEKTGFCNALSRPQIHEDTFSPYAAQVFKGKIRKLSSVCCLLNLLRD